MSTITNEAKGNQACSRCGAKTQATIKKRYLAKEIGLDNVSIENMPMIVCSECGSEDPVYVSLDRILDTVAKAVAKKPSPLSGKEFRFLRKNLGQSPLRFAEILGTTRETISRWENGHLPVSDSADRFIRTLVLMEEHEREAVLVSLIAIKKDAASENIQIDADHLCATV